MQQGGELRWVAWWVPKIARIASQRALQMLVVTGFALTLAACDKCSMPVWRHDPRPPRNPATTTRRHSNSRSRRERFLYHSDQVFQRERLRQECELAKIGKLFRRRQPHSRT